MCKSFLIPVCSSIDIHVYSLLFSFCKASSYLQGKSDGRLFMVTFFHLLLLQAAEEKDLKVNFTAINNSDWYLEWYTRGKMGNSPSLEAQSVFFFSSSPTQYIPTSIFIMQWAGKAFKADSYRCRENPVCQHTHTCLASQQAWRLRAKQLPGGKITWESASLWVSCACVFLAPWIWSYKPQMPPAHLAFHPGDAPFRSFSGETFLA